MLHVQYQNSVCLAYWPVIQPAIHGALSYVVSSLCVCKATLAS